ncbi:molybdenum cofactor biosynthesis protein B [Sporosarcina sp. NCCP-2222]|uniref:MogA/MoaB family molybdenum cofactor biosynthesis protein n=1 Tax=Sporosarcina sp. NCCP-2222 TaxID=2935073 RepID=UPI00207F9F53|nr:molybdenum cofactor biosynthesis protein B [Sporosarcina sp. NCCP-2222]GKV56063.1 molybdenum cofactor biosynthesis protein B [Sporosarcina sp. NCCP-2222]
MSEVLPTDKRKPIGIAILTVSDTRTAANDKSGDVIEELARAAGHLIQVRQICSDERDSIESVMDRWLQDGSIEAIVITGGTGIGLRDVTIETVTPYFTKPIDGFGELFRFLSYTEDVGSKAMLSRATAGGIGEKALFALPGSSKAVKLAMEKLIVPELHHIVYELTKHRL